MIKGVILDLDGTVYRGKEEVPGAGRFVGQLREHDLRWLFVTNRANRTPATICAHLLGYGIGCDESHVLTAAQATAQYLPKGSAYCIGEDGLRVAMEEAGFVLTDDAPDYVIVSFDRTFNYEKLARACRLIQGGAKFVATNPDRALKTDEGLVPGTGALVAAVVAGSGVDPLMIGKPERLIFDIALQRLGLTRDEVIAVGDNVATDIPAGERSGMRTALILTGVSSREDASRSGIRPTWIVESYEELWRIIGEENGSTGPV